MLTFPQQDQIRLLEFMCGKMENVIDFVIKFVIYMYSLLNGEISESWSVVCAPVRRAVARGLSTVPAQKPCSISLVL